MNTIDNRVKALIAEHLHIEVARVTDEATIFDDLGGDDLDRLEITVALETEFKIELSDDDAETIQTVGDAVKLIERKAEVVQ